MPNICIAVVWCQAQILNHWYVLPVRDLLQRQIVYFHLCWQCFGPEADSLMTRCPHTASLTITHSEAQDEGRRGRRREQNNPETGHTEPHYNPLGCTAGQPVNLFHGRATKQKSFSTNCWQWKSWRVAFLDVRLCVHEKLEGGLCVLPTMCASSCLSTSAALPPGSEEKNADYRIKTKVAKLGKEGQHMAQHMAPINTYSTNCIYKQAHAYTHTPIKKKKKRKQKASVSSWDV